MKNLVHLTTAIAPTRESLQRSVWRRYFLFIPFIAALASFAFSLTAQAVDPPPDGDYGNGNTAEGGDALFSLTTGANNTAVGANALYYTEEGDSNTAVGVNALSDCREGDSNNTAVGDAAASFTQGSNNTALGFFAMSYKYGDNNTATGHSAMVGDIWTLCYNNTANGAWSLHHVATGSNNVAVGYYAMYNDTDGSDNTAIGGGALNLNTTGSSNVAAGWQALLNNTTGNENTAIGLNALINTTGSRNTALGAGAGGALTTGDDNIDIGNSGVAGESATIRIGITGAHRKTYIAGIYGVNVARAAAPVYVESNGHLGIRSSSARFKDQIKPMDRTSEAILALRPVTFRYKKQLDPDGVPQFGLVAEEVAKVNPNLVVRDEEGKPCTVRYEAVNAMLLNEFLKEHGKVAALEAKIAQQESTNSDQQKAIQALTVSLKEQATQIEKVSAQLAASDRSAPHIVVNNQSKTAR